VADRRDCPLRGAQIVGSGSASATRRGVDLEVAIEVIR
jgi:hypothetical protein